MIQYKKNSFNNFSYKIVVMQWVFQNLHQRKKCLMTLFFIIGFIIDLKIMRFLKPHEIITNVHKLSQKPMFVSQIMDASLILNERKSNVLGFS